MSQVLKKCIYLALKGSLRAWSLQTWIHYHFYTVGVIVAFFAGLGTQPAVFQTKTELGPLLFMYFLKIISFTEHRAGMLPSASPLSSLHPQKQRSAFTEEKILQENLNLSAVVTYEPPEMDVGFCASVFYPQLFCSQKGQWPKNV